MAVAQGPSPCLLKTGPDTRTWTHPGSWEANKLFVSGTTHACTEAETQAASFKPPRCN